MSISGRKSVADGSDIFHNIHDTIPINENHDIHRYIGIP